MRKNIPALTSLRFLAALWVFLFHLHGMYGEIGVRQLDNLVMAGPVGMTFFFLLSGFILAHASGGAEVLADSRAFFVRRFARIYPIYISVLLCGWAVVGFADELGSRPVRSGIVRAIADLTLTNAWFPQLFGGIRGGTWSLSVEAFFYLLFPLILFHVVRLSTQQLSTGIKWCVGTTVFFSLMGKYNQPMDSNLHFVTFYSMPIFRLPEFIAGVMAGVMSLRSDAEIPGGRRLCWMVLATVCLLAFFGKAFPEVTLGALATPCLLGSFLYFSRTEDGLAHRIFSLPAFVFLGEASFALYLVQLVTIPWFVGHAATLGTSRWIVCFFATLAVASLVHVLIERPMRPFITRWLSPKVSA